MIGKYIWQKETDVNGLREVHVICDICGDEKIFQSEYLNRLSRKGQKTVPCDSCIALEQLEKDLCGVVYASNGVFLK